SPCSRKARFTSSRRALLPASSPPAARLITTAHFPVRETVIVHYRLVSFARSRLVNTVVSTPSLATSVRVSFRLLRRSFTTAFPRRVMPSPLVASILSVRLRWDHLPVLGFALLLPAVPTRRSLTVAFLFGL